MAEEDDQAEEEAQLERARARIGETLRGKWVINDLLGIGGTAAVYRATHRNGNEVAVKVLHRELSRYPEYPEIKKRFLREAYAANRVRHDGAVRVTDDDVDDEGSPFLVMDLLQGETLAARLEHAEGRLPVEEVLALAAQLLAILAAAHTQGIVHRDIKPENIFLTREGKLKVLDFGIARLTELSGSGNGATATATRLGSAMGTPAFMAPEQARGHWGEVDQQTDLWAVGATLFTLLTGELVHGDGTSNEMLALAITQPPRSISSLLPELPSPIVALIDRALEYKKEARWANAAEMQQALSEASRGVFGATPAAAPPAEAASSGHWVSQPAQPTIQGLSHPASAPAPAQLRRLVWVAAGTLTLFIAVLAWLFSGSEAPQVSSAEQPSAEQPSAEVPSTHATAAAASSSAAPEEIGTIAAEDLSPDPPPAPQAAPKAAPTPTTKKRPVRRPRKQPTFDPIAKRR